ncbi:unnamed protein product [Discosporangium mesarthrocarpum]
MLVPVALLPCEGFLWVHPRVYTLRTISRHVFESTKNVHTPRSTALHRSRFTCHYYAPCAAHTFLVLEAAGGIVLWGSPTLFQLKQASHLKRMSQNDRVPPQELSSEAMEKEVLSFGIGGVFIMMASPAVGRMADFIKTCVSNTVSKGRLLALHEGLQQAERAGGPLQVMKQFKGFLDGALQDGELTSAHAKYMGDIKALAQTQEVKQAILSAEHLNRTFLKYAISSVPPLIEGDAQGRAGATAGAGGDARKG